ncbi:MAG: ABC transporter permease [Burkholderiaceae bacterium]|jgi:peptide/nickel transport system permease protein
MQPVILWTDVLLWLLLGCIAYYGRRVLRDPLARATWRQVFRGRLAAVTAVILAVALLIAALDSLHYRPALATAGQNGVPAYSPQTVSVLDAGLRVLVAHQEKSYSAPFALFALNKESVVQEGIARRDYPRLRWGGAHLPAVGAQTDDIVRRIGQGAALALAGVIVLELLMRRLGWAWLRQPAGRAARAALYTVLLIAGLLVFLAPAYHVLGTDKVGVDVLYVALKSVRTAVVLGLLTTLVTLPLGIFAGLAAGYFKGWVDDVIQYVYTTLNAIPSVLLIASAVLILQVMLDRHAAAFPTALERSDVRLFFLCFILGLTSWTGLARLLRGEALRLREAEYVQAARAFGASHWRILTGHLLPNVMPLILITVVMDFSGLVLAEAVLSYVGVGVDPGTMSYGTMINAARMELSREPVVWWSLAGAFTFMLLLVLSANLFADAVRDAFDPRTRQRAGV